MENKKNQKGFTLIEILIGLGVISVLSILAFLVYAMVHKATLANQAERHIKMISAEIHAVYQNAPLGHLGQDLTSNLVVAHAFPKEMVQSDGSIVSSFETPLTITVSNHSIFSFTFHYQGIPSGVCINMAKDLFVGAEQIKVNGTSLSATHQHLNISQTITLCKSQPKETMDFTFTN